MRILSTIALFAFFSANAWADSGDVVHHPAPTDPVYLDAGSYEALKKKLPAPPKPKSESQKKDVEELFRLQKSRTEAECEAARSEIFVSLESFFGKELPALEEEQKGMLTDFFAQVRNDGDFFIQKMKKDFPRDRPFVYIKGIEPCVAREVTLAYPSGHAALSRLYALILGDFFPAKKAALDKRAREIGMHRVLVGMHHPTDIASGRKLADLLYADLKKSEKYRAAQSVLAKSLAENKATR